jgi:hypothetical protein
MQTKTKKSPAKTKKSPAKTKKNQTKRTPHWAEVELARRQKVAKILLGLHAAYLGSKYGYKLYKNPPSLADIRAVFSGGNSALVPPPLPALRHNPNFFEADDLDVNPQGAD